MAYDPRQAAAATHADVEEDADVAGMDLDAAAPAAAAELPGPAFDDVPLLHAPSATPQRPRSTRESRAASARPYGATGATAPADRVDERRVMRRRRGAAPAAAPDDGPPATFSVAGSTATWNGARGEELYHPDYERHQAAGRRIVSGGETVYDPDTGRPRNAGGGGFALPSGSSSYAVHQGPGGPTSIGAPTATQPGRSEVIDFGRYLSHHADVTPQAFPPAAAAGPRLPAFPGVRPLTDEAQSSFVVADVVQHFTGRRDQFPGQRATMAGRSAAELMAASGAPVPPGQLDLLHGARFQHGGLDHVNPQVQENFTVGPHGANIRHLTHENALRDHLLPMAGVVPTSFIPHDLIAPEHHVAAAAEFVVHSTTDPTRGARYPLDLGDAVMPRAADNEPAAQDLQAWGAWNTVHDMIHDGHDPESFGAGFTEQHAAWDAHQEAHDDAPFRLPPRIARPAPAAAAAASASSSAAPDLADREDDE